MKVSYQLVITTLVLLLSLQTCQTLLGCGAFERPSISDIEKCILIEEVFESALLNDKTNLHILRDTFLSSLHPSPHLLNIRYYIITETGYENVSISVTWTNSKVFSVIDLLFLQNFLSGIMTGIFYMEGILSAETIEMHLNISGYHFYEIKHLMYGIIIISHRLWPYAINQAKLNNWKGENKGYVLPESYGILEMWIIFLTSIFFTGIGIAISLKVVRGLSEIQDESDADIKRSLFWCSIVVLTVTNSIEILAHVIMLIKEPLEQTFRPLAILKMGVITTLVLIAPILGFLFGKKKSSQTNSPSEEYDSYSIHSAYYGCAICNLFLLAFFVSISIITTTALLAVYPILVLSSISYICMALFSIIIMLAALHLYNLREQRIENRNYKAHWRCCFNRCNVFLYGISLFAIHLIFLLYLMILAKVDHTYANYVFQDASSFLPSIILGAIGYFAKKKLTTKRKEGFSEKELDSDDSGEPEVLPLEEKTKLNVPPLTLAQGDRESVSSDKEDEYSKLLPDTQETEL